MIFTDRSEAGRFLADALVADPLVRSAERVVVLAIPRGGVPVGLPVARALGGPLDVAVARELRTPYDPDVKFGAVAADGYAEVDQAAVERLGLSPEEVEVELERRRRAVDRRLALYRKTVAPAPVEGALVVVVDDGIASGGTAWQACTLARRLGAQQVVLAVPIAPETAEEALADVTDRVVVLSCPDEFLAVSQGYQDFPRIDDDMLLEMLGQDQPEAQV